MSDRAIPFRQMVIDALDLLSSEAEQLEYEGNVPQFDITPEILASWASDGYHPDEPAFRAAFSESELEHLRRFDETFQSNVDLLPKSRGTVRDWLSSPSWKLIMRAAANARANIAG